MTEVTRMRVNIRIAIVVLALLVRFAALDSGAAAPDQPDKFFREFVHLSDEQISDVHAGRAVATVLQSPTPDEVFVFGAVHINSTPERFFKLASDLDALQKLPNYLALGKFSEPPQLADLAGFTFEESDLKDLRSCTPGHCQVQLPAEAIDDLQRSIDWNAPDYAEKANRLWQEKVLQSFLRYQQGGNAALGVYRDKNHPTAVADAFASLTGEIKALPVYLPEVNRYLLDYPNTKSNQIRSDFHWEKVNFGLKPTLRIVQTAIYRGTAPGQAAYAIMAKQLYASHYFETALDGTVCMNDTQGAGFYLITIKGSQQAGLTGLKGSILRKIVVDKTRSSLQRALASYKEKLETQGD